MSIEYITQLEHNRAESWYLNSKAVCKCAICGRFVREDELEEPHACATKMGTDGDCCESCVEEWKEEFWEYVEEWDDEHIKNGENR